MDRFMLKDVLDYPSPAEEAEVLRRIDSGIFLTASEPVVSVADVKRLQSLVGRVYIDPAIVNYIVGIGYVTRHPRDYIEPRLAALRRLRGQPAGEHRLHERRPGARAHRRPQPRRPRRRQGADAPGAAPPRHARLRGGRRRGGRREHHRRDGRRDPHSLRGVGRRTRHDDDAADEGEEQALRPRAPQVAQPARGGVRLGLPRPQPRLRRPARLRAGRRGARHRLARHGPAPVAARQALRGDAASRTSCSSSTPVAAWRPRPAAASRRSRWPSPRPASSATSPSGTETSSASSAAPPARRSPTTCAAPRPTSSCSCAPSTRRPSSTATRATSRRSCAGSCATSAAVSCCSSSPTTRSSTPALDELLRRLHVQHEILWVTVEDADPTAIDGDRTAFDVADTYTLPTLVRLDPQVRAGVCRLGRRPRAAHDRAARPPRRSTTRGSGRPTRSSRPSSPCSRGSAVRAADAPPPGFYAPDPYAAHVALDRRRRARARRRLVRLGVVVDAGEEGRRAAAPGTSDRLTRLRADYTRQIDLVLDRAAAGEITPAPGPPAAERARAPLRPGGVGHPRPDDDADRAQRVGIAPHARCPRSSARSTRVSSARARRRPSSGRAPSPSRWWRDGAERPRPQVAGGRSASGRSSPSCSRMPSTA